MPSKALEVNIASSRVDITVDRRYDVLQEVMGRYHGVREGLQAFLKEICHPYKNWEYIVKEARGYALNYFHLLKAQQKGPEASRLYEEIFFQAIDGTRNEGVRVNATDNLLFFIHKIIREAGDNLNRFLPVLDYAFDRIRSYPEEIFSLFVKSYYRLDRIGKSYLDSVGQGEDFSAINRLLVEYYRYTYDYWLGLEDPLAWFEKESGRTAKETGLNEIFGPISHNFLSSWRDGLEGIVGQSEDGDKATLDRLIELPGYGQLVKQYGEMPRKLLAAGKQEGLGNQWQLIFLLHIMNIAGLSSIHEETLRDINRTLVWLIENEALEDIRKSLEKTFEILRVSVGKYPGTALNCVLTMGKGVYKTDESDLVDFFMDSVVSLGFQAPEIRGVGDDWQVRSNPNHVRNICTWLELIELNPKWSKKLLSSLIIHLSLHGVFIKDTDLFPRDITRLLNSDISTVYNLTKQLARLFPAYFNDIGAEGRLRDISTKIDEICMRKDILIHFLRKQSHVESSNRIVGLVEGTLDFWKTKSKEGIRAFVPSSIYDQIETEGPYIDGVHTVVTHLLRNSGNREVTALLGVEEEGLNGLMGQIEGASDLDMERVGMALTLYKLLHQKYHLGLTEMDSYLSQLQFSSLPDLGDLKEALREKDPKERLIKLCSYLEKLKGIILSPDTFETREDIYRKRHFAVDIPSMYGSYHEMKFDALGLTFRLESLVNVLLEEMAESIDLNLITWASFHQIYEYLGRFDRALRLDGISSLEMERQLDLLAHSLDIRGFSSTQYLDIFRGFSRTVNNIVNDYFNNIHEENLLKILAQFPVDGLMPKYLPPGGAIDPERLTPRVMEIFLRDRIASSLGLQQLDIFLSRILRTLHHQSDQLPKKGLRLLLSYDIQKAVTPVANTKKDVGDIIHLGNKGLNLVRITDYGLPVPPGFIITTEVFRCREILEGYPPANRNLEEQVLREVAGLEKLTDRSFGDPANPLLLSVRSGSSISQPGMMVTFLDVGINEEIVQGMIARTGNEWFGWDTYRRFLQAYGMGFGLIRDEFDAIMNDFKGRLGIDYKRDFSGSQMREIALAYRSLIQDSGVEVEISPTEQLFVAIRKVLDSWNAPKAMTYRRIMGISDDWGTAVTVQTMVFGNFSHQAGAGVFFTHNPRWTGDMLVLWGDFTPGNQGEDVVSGLVRTLPVSKRQAEIEEREKALALETLFPEIYQTLRQWAKHLVYEKKWSPQEIEFTFEGPRKEDLYFLQTRDMVIRERKKTYSFDLTPDASHKLLGHGIGVSGGAMSGRIVFTLEEIRYWRETEPETPLIIVRNDTVPDDIEEIYEADGLLTGRGGSTSHAAIVAHRLGKTCVVGCANLVCREKEKTCSFDQRVLRSGERLSMDGREGSVYLGQISIKEMESP